MLIFPANIALLKKNHDQTGWKKMCTQEQHAQKLTSGVDPGRKMSLQCGLGIHTQNHLFICDVLIIAI
jgi:hypothetical protein